MSDSTMDPVAAEPTGPATAGGLLRRARQAQGLHIAALAAAIKVQPKKLEALEADQFDQLPDATFTRALANTVCRTLKIDAAPVLALLPPLGGQPRLEHVAEGLKTPFEEGEGGGGGGGGGESMLVSGPVLWLAGLLIIAAVAVYAMPSSWLKWRPGANAVAAGAPAASVADAGTGAAPEKPVTGTAAAAPAASEAAAGADPAMPPGSDTSSQSAEADADGAAAAASAPGALAPESGAAKLLALTPDDGSWIEVVDARGKTLLSRLVQANERVELDGALPFKIKIGNASATHVEFRGQPLDLAPYTRDNIAKLQLK